MLPAFSKISEMSPEFETENPVTLLVPADVTEAVQLYTVPGVSEVSVKVAVPPAHYDLFYIS